MIDGTSVPGTGELGLLLGFLNAQRSAVAAKCDGLGEETAHRPLLPTSPLMTVAGLVSHLRWVEQSWFEHILLGEPELGPWTDEDPDREFRVDGVPLPRLLADYRRQCARSDEIVTSVGLDAAAAVERHGAHPTARWIVLHMIEETARHAGHLDIVRELLDGRTGYP
ncbi:Protein of unknown function [Thermomonospora echinospora]|uniref:DinB superfamily protein n=1 Tax=Thermomonospora echinospora TaxID=1992 RepID=A0A1H6DNX9_9ACTN|nr:DinB family protein [Thermomonospora echinospora]SEG86891.1 Protein of unknown function [Thermomonospora echinospora]